MSTVVSIATAVLSLTRLVRNAVDVIEMLQDTDMTQEELDAHIAKMQRDLRRGHEDHHAAGLDRIAGDRHGAFHHVGGAFGMIVRQRHVDVLGQLGIEVEHRR